MIKNNKNTSSIDYYKDLEHLEYINQKQFSDPLDARVGTNSYQNLFELIKLKPYRFLTLWKTLFKGYVKYYFRQFLLKSYRQKVFLKFQSNNVFLSTILPHRELAIGFNLSAGLLEDYRKKKKKKKTYMLGYELGYLFGQTLVDNDVMNTIFFFKGHGAQKRGVYQAFLKLNLNTTQFFDVTPLVHNGTKVSGRRRL